MMFMNEVNYKWYEREKGGLVDQVHELIIGHFSSFLLLPPPKSHKFVSQVSVLPQFHHADTCNTPTFPTKTMPIQKLNMWMTCSRSTLVSTQYLISTFGNNDAE